MEIQEGPDGIKEKALKRNWPNEEGLEAGTNTQEGRTTNLVPENSLIPKRLKVGLGE